MKWYLWVVNGPMSQTGHEEIPLPQESQAGLIIVTLVGGGFISYVLAQCVPVEFWYAVFGGCLSLFVGVAIWWWRRAAERVDPPAEFVEVTDNVITVSQAGEVSKLRCEDVCFIRAEANKHVQFIELSSETDNVKFKLATKAGDDCGSYLHSKCDYAVYMDRRNKEHFPVKLDRADSIWANRLNHNRRTAIDSIAGGGVILACMGAFLWVSPEAKLSYTVIAGGLGMLALFVTGAMRLIKWQTKVKQMSQLKDAGDFEGALRLIVEK